MTAVFNESADETEVADRPSGWETAPETGGTACKRHRWNGGDTCVRCGATKADVQNARTGSDGSGGSVEVVGRARQSRGRSGDLETLISIGWAGIGFGISRQPWLLQEPTGRKDSSGDEITVAGSIGAAWSVESAVAGKRIDRALRRTPVYRHIVRWITPAGVAADIVPLFIPPIVVGLAAYKPEVAREFKPLLMGLMIPVLAEAAKLAEQQAELVANLGNVNDEVIQQASDFIDNLVGVAEDS